MSYALPFAVPLVVALVAPIAAAAENPAIEGVIGSQLDAFETNDVETAFTFASPMIQGMFRTPGNFGTMVAQGYPMVRQPGEVEFLELDDLGAVQRQRVMIRDGSGVFHVLDYDMIQVDGDWRINGVSLVRAPQVGA